MLSRDIRLPKGALNRRDQHYRQKMGSFGSSGKNIWVNTHADCCASTAVHISTDPSRGRSVFVDSACPPGLAFMGVTRELRPGDLSTSAVEQPGWALV